MARFYSVTWQEGNFDRSASILAFDSKAARAAYPNACPQRVEAINSKQKAALIREGRLVRLVLWDGFGPFNITG